MTLVGDDSTLGSNSRVPLPEAFGGNLDKWEDWSWSLKNYVLLFYSDTDDWFDFAETLEVEFTDDFLKTERPSTGTTPMTDDLTGEILEDYQRRVNISKRLHYLLANLTVGAARTEVKNNLKGNGFETWRRLSKEFSLPGIAKHLGLLSKILNYTFSQSNFEQDFSAWENLKTRYEYQTGTSLPDSVLMATLLNKMAGPLQTHIRLNSASLKTYAQLRELITNYYQSRHIMTQSTVDTGSTSADIDVLRFERNYKRKEKEDWKRRENWKEKGNYGNWNRRGKRNWKRKRDYASYGNFEESYRENCQGKGKYLNSRRSYSRKRKRNGRLQT